MENHSTPSRKTPVFRRPAIVLDSTEKNSESSSSDAPDGVHFRKPLAPVQMTISPGNAANDTKLAEKLKRLELSRKKTTRSHNFDLKTPSKVDLVATERLFVESSVENIAQTPRNQSVREPMRTPARFTPHYGSLTDIPRDSMRSNATYVLSTPLMDKGLHPHHDPFTPSLATPSRKTSTAVATTPLAYEEKLERQFVALSSWANVILDSASFVSEIDLGTSKQDASRTLQEMLTRPPTRNGLASEGARGTKGKYTDLCLRKKCLDYLKRADSVYQSIAIPGLLKAMVDRGQISIRQGIEVYANIGVQTSILSLLFSLHPFWLFIAVETVCAEFNDHDTASLDARLPFSSSSFAPATVRFIHEHVLANAKLMAKKKFTIGTVKKIVTEKGREMLHKHCITCILSMAVLLEYAKNSYLFENTPGLFVKNSEIKTVNDFCTELSRLVLSASGTPLNKAFDKTSFRRSYRQSFLEEYQYVMKSVRDMADGIILGRLIELLTDSQPLSIIGNMRNPQGDRLRKKGNVDKALTAAQEAGIDVDGISIDHILSAHRESCLDLMWRLVGVYVKKKAEQEPLRRESLCLDGDTDVEDAADGIAESAFTLYQQLAFQYGLSLSKWSDLEDGVLLSSIWQNYNPTAPDVRFYDGDCLFDKVAHAAESDLGIPLALSALRDERQLGLFAHMFLSRLISYKRLRDSEMSDGESDASSNISIIRKEGANLSEETERIHRVRKESAQAISPVEEERLKMEEEKRREEELRRRFEEEEEERLSTEWRSPSRGAEAVEREEMMLLDKGEEERIEHEMRRAEEERLREEEAERVKREEEERLAEEQRIREEEEERRRREEEELERVRREREEEDEKIRREEEVRLEEERKREEEEKKERLRVIEEARVKAEEEERLRREEEERVRIIEEARQKAEEEERVRREEEEERRRLIEEARLLAEEEERLRREKEERRERAALTIQCWIRRVHAVRLLNGLRAERDERLQREEEERRDQAARRIASWICDRLEIRAAKMELEKRREAKREEEEERERLRVEEEWRRKKAVHRIELWYSSMVSMRAARSLMQSLRAERWRREEEARIERERAEAEERERLEEEARRVHVLRETAATQIQRGYRGWLLMREAKAELNRLKQEEEIKRWEEELERRRLEEEERQRRVEEERLRREEMERLIRIREEEERVRREEEERLIREEARLEAERIEREMEEKRLRDEEEARLEMERLWEEEQERIRREQEAQLERERQVREEEERRRREEEARVERERVQREEEAVRRRLTEEEEERAAKQREAHEKEERLYQEMVADHERQERDRRVEEMRENRAARVIQSAIKSCAHKRRVEKRTIELLESMEATPRRNERMTIGGISDDQLLAGVREIRRRQWKLSLTISRMPKYSNVQAAVKIQAWWRGIMARRAHAEQIELIAVRMKEFRQTADKIMEGDSRERSIPVSKRLEKARDCLQNPLRLYDIKVACYTTMSLCRLSSLYCEMAIVLRLPALLIHTFTVQADRSPAFEEIIEFGVQALEEMVKCPTARVRESMVSQGADVVRIAAHQMLAFQHNTLIAATAIKILRKCKEILPVETHAETFAKMHPYFLKKGEEKFGKLPTKDVRHKEFVQLKKAFPK